MTSPLAEKFLSLGLALHREAKFDDALEYYRQALNADPKDERVRLAMAECYRESHHLPEALDVLDGLSSPMASNVKGMVLADMGRLTEALPLLSKAIQGMPGSPDPLVNLAGLVAKMSRAEEAMNYFLAALKLDPLHVGALSGLGLLERELRHYDNAEACLKKALEREPQRAELWNNLGLIQDEMGKRPEAQAAYRRCLDLLPGHAQAQCNLGMSLLALGKLKEGFAAYEARWRLASMPPRAFPQPQWRGEDLTGKTILLHAEQCLGDTLHFCRYAKLVKALGAAKVIFETQPALKSLLSGLEGVDVLVARDKEPLPAFDLHCPLLSLPTAMGADWSNLPTKTPYLSADAERVSEKRQWLNAQPGRKIGVAWRGNAKFRGEDWRSPGLELIVAALKASPNIRAVCLQAGGRAEFLSAFGQQALDIGHEIDQDAPAFAETAALMEGLDLIISSDTSVPHLAGALDRPTWILLPEPAEWRWLENRDDSPWYPSARLFRQTSRDDWGSALAKLQNALAEWETPTCA